MSSSLTVFSCAFALCKVPFNTPGFNKFISSNKHYKSFFNAVAIVLAIILLTCIALLLIPFAFVKCLAYVYVKIKYRKNFYGFLPGPSAWLDIFDEKFNMFGIIIIEENEEISKFSREFRKIVDKIYDSNPEISCIMKYVLGYNFFVRDCVKSNEIFAEVNLDKSVINEDDIFEYLKNLTNFDRTKMLEVKLFKQPFKSDNKYILLLKADHSLCDAFGLIALAKSYILDKIVKDTKSLKIDLTKFKKSTKLDDLYLTGSHLLTSEPYLQGQHEHQHYCSFIEEEPVYIGKIRAIRKKYNLSFNEIYSASLVKAVSDFLRKCTGQCPKDLLVTHTARGELDDILKIVNQDYDQIKLTNKIAPYHFLAPTTGEGRPATEILDELHRRYMRMFRSLDLTLNYMTQKYLFAFFPITMNKKIFLPVFDNVLIMITNSSQVDKGTILGRDILGCLPTASLPMKRGIFLATLTYDGRLHLVLTSRQKIITGSDDLKFLMDRMLESINDLYDTAK